MQHKAREVEHPWDWMLLGLMMLVLAGVILVTYQLPQKLLFIMIVIMMTGLTGYIYYSIRAARSLSYEVGREGIMINYGYKKLLIPYNDILALEVKERPGLSRLAGNEWPGSYSGYFTESRQKKLAVVYATQLKNLVKIQTSELNYFVSPQDNRRFIEKVEQYWSPPQHSNEGPTAKPRPHLWQTSSGAVLLVVNIIAVGLVVGYVYYLTKTIGQMPLHYNLLGEVDRYGSPAELYFTLIGTAIVFPVIIVVGDMMSRRGVPAHEASRLLLIPLGMTIFMGLVILSML